MEFLLLIVLVGLLGAGLHAGHQRRRRRARAQRNRELRRRSYDRWKCYGRRNYMGRARSHRHKFK